jgi:hypothetical protein
MLNFRHCFLIMEHLIIIIFVKSTTIFIKYYYSQFNFNLLIGVIIFENYWFMILEPSIKNYNVISKFAVITD